MDIFADALVAKEKSDRIPDEFNLFGRFVGEWDFIWTDGHGTDKERHVKGEWIFSWILEGTAIQDIFICPSRVERAKNLQPDAEYGTTIRIYNPNKKTWDVFYGCRGEANLLEARAENDTIVLTCLTMESPDQKMKWVFSDITETSFHWACLWSSDASTAWKLVGELSATRRK